jgi:hypothetical protein
VTARTGRRAPTLVGAVQITVNAANDAPSFTVGANQIALEDPACTR